MHSSLPDLKNLFEKATKALAQGDAHVALQLAQQAASGAPNNPDVFNLLGVCAITLRDQATAEQCWLHAIRLHTETTEARYNLALLYTETLRYDLAQQHLEQTIKLVPARAAAYARLAMLQAQTNQAGSAEQNYRHALRIEPGDAATWNNLALLLAAQKRDADAEDCYRIALTLSPNDPQAYSNLGVLLVSCRRDAEAEICYRRTLKLDATSAAALANLGLLLNARKDYVGAEHYLREALRLSPGSVEILTNLAILLAERQRDSEAEHYYQKALLETPNSEVVLSNFGVFLAYRLRDAEAEASFRRVLAMTPDNAPAMLNLSMLLLAQGRLGEGWRYHEARYAPSLPTPDAPTPHLPFPQWQGETLRGKSLLIWPEQGHGDLIQFCRYLPLIKAQGAACITLVCRSTLVELMRTLEGVDAVIGSTDIGQHGLDCDYWTFPMSLPLHCHTELDSIPAQVPYLHANAERLAFWSPRLPPSSGKRRVGIVWRGNPKHANDDKRSLPGLSALAPLWAFDSAQYFSLQIVNGPDIAEDLACTSSVIELGSQIRDFADTAAILQQMDLLISVDTAIAHLAGALGKPCWVLLPNYRTDWRWMRARSDTPWYPSLRLFRQAPEQTWEDVIAQVASSLKDHISYR